MSNLHYPRHIAEYRPTTTEPNKTNKTKRDTCTFNRNLMDALAHNQVVIIEYSWRYSCLIDSLFVFFQTNSVCCHFRHGVEKTTAAWVVIWIQWSITSSQVSLQWQIIWWRVLWRNRSDLDSRVSSCTGNANLNQNCVCRFECVHMH